MFDKKSAKAVFRSPITLGKGFARCIPKGTRLRGGRVKK